MFDIDNFVNTPVAGEFSTEYQPIPEGEFPAIISDVKGRALPSGSNVLDVVWEIVDPIVDDIGRNKVSQTVWLDVTEEGGLDQGKGKNVGLGRLLEILKLNGKKWSPTDFIGKQGTVLVSHRMHDGKTYEQVKSVSA